MGNKSRKEMSNFQKGYNEAVETQKNRSKPTRALQKTVTPALGMTAKEKQGYKVGSKDVDSAMKYISKESAKKTAAMKEAEKKARSKMKQSNKEKK